MTRGEDGSRRVSAWELGWAEIETNSKRRCSVNQTVVGQRAWESHLSYDERVAGLEARCSVAEEGFVGVVVELLQVRDVDCFPR